MIPLPPVIGHRGAAAHAPENTLASFARAAALGARMVEFDVRLSADSVPVVFHDDTVERTTDGRGAVAALTLAALKRLDAGAWFAPAFAGERIPTLAETLAACLGLGLAVNIELKPHRGAERATAIAALDVAGRLWPSDRPPPLVSSFRRPALETAREVAPDWPRGLLVGALPRTAATADALACTTVHADHRRLSASRIRAVGRPVLAYTVNDVRRLLVLREMGVAAVFSDAPETATAVES